MVALRAGVARSLRYDEHVNEHENEHVNKHVNEHENEHVNEHARIVGVMLEDCFRYILEMF